MATTSVQDNLPLNWENPEWTNVGKTHDWRNHVSDEVAQLWPTFSEVQKKALARQAEALAMNEHWD